MMHGSIFPLPAALVNDAQAYGSRKLLLGRVAYSLLAEESSLLSRVLIKTPYDTKGIRW
jgi:hypothetical protein